MDPIKYELKEYYRYRIYTWNLANGDIGQAIEQSAHYPDKTWQVTGTFGSGGNLRIEGTNDDREDLDDAQYAVLHDTTETALDITAAGFSVVLENTHAMRPRVTAGDANTALVVKACCVVGQGGGR